MLSITRALLKDPEILILDEATSSLDSQTEKLIKDFFQNICCKKTTIIVAHRLSTIKNANLILVMKNGKIIEQGTHEFLLLKEGYYFQMWKIQQEEKLMQIKEF